MYIVFTQPSWCQQNTSKRLFMIKNGFTGSWCQQRSEEAGSSCCFGGSRQTVLLWQWVIYSIQENHMTQPSDLSVISSGDRLLFAIKRLSRTVTHPVTIKDLCHSFSAKLSSWASPHEILQKKYTKHYHFPVCPSSDSLNLRIICHLALSCLLMKPEVQK